MGDKYLYRHLIYKEVAIPIMTYCSVAWYHRATIASVQRRLITTQRALLLQCTKACKTTSTAAMQVVNGGSDYAGDVWENKKQHERRMEKLRI
jgi:hypothetical protein